MQNLELHANGRKLLTDFDPARRPKYPEPKRAGWSPPRPDLDDVGRFIMTSGSAPSKAEKE
jgi:hypothetical protein